MRRGVGGAVFEPVEERRDRELTLGPTTLGIFGIGLLTLCGVCFVFGYAMGRHVSPASTAPVATAAGGPSAAQILSNQPKPSASPVSSPAAPVSSPASSPAAEPVTTSTEAALPAATLPPAPQKASVSTAPAPTPTVVQTALPTQAGTGSQQSNGAVHAALPQAGTWMVQIAAVSHQEDADVLVSALRRRGYSVSVHREPIDGLMHVQVGPFGSHDAAAAMRQKLLNDGYNAIIQP